MPTLELANQIHPGVLMEIALLGMMFNTAVGMFYSFTVRFIKPESKSFKPAVVVTGLLGFGASLVGFTLIVAIVIVWARKGIKTKKFNCRVKCAWLSISRDQALLRVHKKYGTLFSKMQNHNRAVEAPI
ncbi:hypothetical protein ACN6MT_19945 [Neobacillus niacini]|uniref:hypothetical protein n=1 Tax=Neobacillus niacini TaxID=86668 RepID=UPI003B020EFB